MQTLLSGERGSKSEKAKADIKLDFVFVQTFLVMEPGISYTPVVQCDSNNFAANSNHYFSCVDSEFFDGGRKFYKSAAAGFGTGGQYFSSGHAEYLDSEKADLVAERL